MGSIINENIRYFKANDPYYFEVDNLPLRDLVENDKNLEEAVLAISGETSFKGIKELARKIKNRIVKFRKPKGSAAQAIGREGFDDLLPYVSGEDGRIYVTPGVFSARTSKLNSYHDGSFEQESSNMSVTVGEPLSQNRLKNQEFNTPGRLEVFQLLADSSGVDPSVLVPSFNAEDFDFGVVGDPAYRIDLIGVAGEDNPYVFLIEGAGFASNHAGTRMNAIGDNIGGTFTEAWENDPESNLHDLEASANNYGKLDFGTGTKKRGSFPLPDDLFNSAPEILNNVITENTNAGFGVALAYILVPAGFTQETTIPTDNVVDVRPIFRSAELTLAERQGIVMADPPASISNPFITQAISIALDERMDNIESAVDAKIDGIVDNDTVTGNFDVFGKLDVVYAGGNGRKSIGKTLDPGRYLVVTVASINLPGNWSSQQSHYFTVRNSATNAQMPSAFSGGADSKTSIATQHDGDGGFSLMQSCTVSSPGTAVEVYMSANGSIRHAYFIRIS